jgi:hypothetical protein
MPPDWRLFHVRKSTGKSLFFEVPFRDFQPVIDDLLTEFRRLGIIVSD